MKFRYQDEEEETAPGADLTLGMGSLLSIFFGVVLVCGIFFGFGYSMGRRNAQSHVLPPANAESPTAQTAATPAPETATPARPQEDSNAAFPPDFKNPTPDENRSTSAAAPDSAGTGESSSTARPRTASPQRVVEQDTTSTTLAAAPATRRTPGKLRAGSPPAAATAAAAAPAAETSDDPPGHPIMVQIAAVSRQEDAQVLAGALRKRGFTPQIRSGLADKFYHVQVGPFPDKQQAESMKQHLLSDGYNAIVK